MEPFRLRRWRPRSAPVAGALFTCARPGLTMSSKLATAALLPVIVIVVGTLAAAAAYWTFHPPPLQYGRDAVIDLGIPNNATASEALAAQARKLVGTPAPRVTLAEGVIDRLLGSVEVYVDAKDWAKVAYPDRATVGSVLARTWCSRFVDRTRFTSVTVRDVSSGRPLHTCYCE